MFLPVCLDPFPHLVLPSHPLSSALLSKLLLSEQSGMCRKACKYKLGYSEINSLAGNVNWDMSDLDVLPHRNENTRFFWWCRSILLFQFTYFSSLGCVAQITRQNKKHCGNNWIHTLLLPSVAPGEKTLQTPACFKQYKTSLMQEGCHSALTGSEQTQAIADPAHSWHKDLSTCFEVMT